MKFIKLILGYLFSKNKVVVKSAKELAESAVEKINQAYLELEESEQKYNALIQVGKEEMKRIREEIELHTTQQINVREIKEATKKYIEPTE